MAADRGFAGPHGADEEELRLESMAAGAYRKNAAARRRPRDRANRRRSEGYLEGLERRDLGTGRLHGDVEAPG